MSLVCEVCLKSYNRGNLVKRLIGNRVARRTTKRQQPNLRSKRLLIDGKTIKLKLCTSCLKKINKESKVKVTAQTI
jgi:large subunit ribosomal protein L28